MKSKLDKDVPIGGDLACFKCDYNLRGLRLDGVCPECGDAVAHSTVKPPFDCDHEWVICMRSSAGLLFYGLAIILLMAIAMLIFVITRFNSIGGIVVYLPVAIVFFILIVTASACQLADHMSGHMSVNKWCVYFMRCSLFSPFLLISFHIFNDVYSVTIYWVIIFRYLFVVVVLMQLVVPAMLAIVMRDLGRLISPKIVAISNWIIYLSLPIPVAGFVTTFAMLILGNFETSLYRCARYAAIPIGVWSILISVLICWLMVVLRSSLSKIKKMLDFHGVGEREVRA